MDRLNGNPDVTRALQALQFTVIVLVASIPIAMEVVTTSTLALGSRQLTKMEAIVSRLAAIEDVAGMTMLCSDKTGTLTLNKMVIQEHTPVFQPEMDQVCNPGSWADRMCIFTGLIWSWHCQAMRLRPERKYCSLCSCSTQCFGTLPWLPSGRSPPRTP